MYRGGKCELRKRKAEVSREMQMWFRYRTQPLAAAMLASRAVRRRARRKSQIGRCDYVTMRETWTREVAR